MSQWPEWQREYIEGGQLEIYMVQLPCSFSGLRFDKVSCDEYPESHLALCLSLGFLA